MPRKKSPELTTEKVAICGYTQHLFEAPWDDPTWKKWGLNDLYEVFESHRPGLMQSGTVEWFQLHREEMGEKPFATGARDPKHVDWLKTAPCPVWMWRHHKEFPTSQPYPLIEILEQFPRRYFNNTISWEIALAMHLGYRTIGLFGIDMALDGVHGESEYSWQRPSVEYFVGLAEGQGIEVVIPDASEILKCGYLYGWDNKSVARQKMLSRLQQLELQEQQTVDQYEAIKRVMHETRGYLKRLHEEPESEQRTKDIEKLTNEEQQIVNEYEACKRTLHEVRGAKNNTQWFLRNYFPGDGPVQDVPRTERSLYVPASSPADSDGKAIRPTNRLLALMKET